jgi:hypothetical protein
VGIKKANWRSTFHGMGDFMTAELQTKQPVQHKVQEGRLVHCYLDVVT